ncbi:hypothetical protein CBM2633_P10009 [Cupriavidus taiwanensis]|nr:competence protein CoiA family protein [Cupriavidus taiwanensis]CAP64280.1 hypothetical protein pRALTA_0667 [Cupriavidus taiwanensis LMG 19424]SPD62711.1 conserved protein of unknown function [Cupriavidus neocaledonicus]ULX56051.1 hypothetical protein A9P79_29210 [Cupriavidus taiwanensis]SOY73760.1 hypothetical protein CBM2592_P10009 [Cupriavidus taiwanensis]SOY73986.1 hypothetical protein CBM2588_P10009 [Cupriavidus taiwanensis]
MRLDSTKLNAMIEEGERLINPDEIHAPGSGDELVYPPALTLHGGTEAMLTFALDGMGVLRHVDAVPNGKQCGCVCPACNEPLIARHGAVRAHSFAHDSGAECRWAHETVLHHLAKVLIAQRGEFAVPGVDVVVERQGPVIPIRARGSLPGRTIYPQSVALEHLLFDVRPDVVITYGDRLLLVEIAVTHKVGQSKLARLQELGHAAVEIDLSRQRPSTVGELAAVLFRNDPRKKWLVNRKQDELRARLEAQCEADYQKHLEETRAFEARVAAWRSKEDCVANSFKEQTAEPLRVAEPSLAARTSLPGVRYAVSGGALVLYNGADNCLRIAIEGQPEALRDAVEQLSFGSDAVGYAMTKSAWARLMSEQGHRFGTITNDYEPPSEGTA